VSGWQSIQRTLAPLMKREAVVSKNSVSIEGALIVES
jgi:hypothetical protein